ncbi:MAG: adenylate/guanylate cyclase domain-containing protein [Candidatus Dormibacteria bacterium]
MDVLLTARREMRCIFTRSDPELVRARWFTTIALGLANVVGAATVFVIGLLAAAPQAVTSRSLWILGSVTAAYLALTLGLGALRALRITSAALNALTSERELEPVELRGILRQQWRHTRDVGIYWAGAAVMVAIVCGPVLGFDPWLVVRDVLAVLLGGMTTAAIAFLLLERGMRPLVARLRELLPEVTACAPSVRARLLLSWMLGSGIPLVGIAIALLEPSGSDHNRQLVLVGVLTGVGILVGAYTSILAAGSVADPLRALHTTMERVAAGDLDATVPIADSGEIGDLQLRFNRMTAGLRERERLRDLFGRHVGADVARFALENSELGGESRDVSVLFVDLKGSTGLAEDMPPESVVAMLNDLFTTVVNDVEAEGGWANKFEGDGALCIFGAPLRQEDHAERALRSARQLRADLVRLRQKHPDLDAGIGVATGTVVAGNVGSRQRYEYTVIGDPVNVAARLCSLAKTLPSRLLVDASSVAAAPAGERSHWMSQGPTDLRGRGAPTEVYAPVAGSRAAAPVA